MKWYAEPPQQRKIENAIRKRSGFLWFPKKLNNEWRWLESAQWLQRCQPVTQLTPNSGCGYSPRNLILIWVDVEWCKS